MKPYVSIIVTAFFCMSASFTGYGNFREAEASISNQLTTALEIVIAENGSGVERIDTVVACRRLAKNVGGPVCVNTSDA